MKNNLDSYMLTEDQIKLDLPQNQNFHVDQKVCLSENLDLKNDRINELYLQSLMDLNQEHGD